MLHMLASNGMGTLTDSADEKLAGTAASLAVTTDGDFVCAVELVA